MTDEEARRLLARLHALEVENADLRERLAYAWQHVEQLRARLLEFNRPLRTAEPFDRTTLEPVAPAELEAALTRLRGVQPLTLA